MVSGIDLLSGEKTGVNLLEEEVPQNVTSGLSLLETKESELPTPTTEVPVAEPVGDPSKFYGKTAVSPPFQGLAPMIMTPEISAYLGSHGRGPRPEGGWDEMMRPLDKTGKPYGDAADDSLIRNAAADTIKGLASLATHPLEVLRGGVDFFMSIPGFLTGMISATSFAGKELLDQVVLGGEVDLERVYNKASEGMQKSMEFFEPAKELVVGERTPESDLTVQVAMAPLSAFSMVGQKVANWEGFKDYPNIRGAAKFAGDITGMIAMGMLVHGSEGKTDFTKRVEDVVAKADKIIEKEQAVSQIPDELVKQTQQKVLEMEKQQVELTAKSIAESLKGEVQIREEIGRQADDLARAKVYPVEGTGLKAATKTEIAKVFRKTPEELADPEATFTSKKGNEYVKKDGKWYKDGVEVTNKFVIRAAERGIDVPSAHAIFQSDAKKYSDLYRKLVGEEHVPLDKMYTKERLDNIYSTHPWLPKNIESVNAMYFADEVASSAARGMDYINDRIDKASNISKPAWNEILSKAEEIHGLKVEEPLTEVDLQTGTPKPEQLKGEDSPFFQNAEEVEVLKNLYSERPKAVESDPELLTQKLINDVNRWYQGDESIDIETTRNVLSTLATKADDLLRMLDKDGEPYFITGVDHLQWKETVTEAADWARGLDRAKIERTDGPRLNAMIPVDVIPDAVADFIRTGKKGMKKLIGYLKRDKLLMEDLYRNKEIFNNTGFWLGRDGMWRYELDDSGSTFNGTILEDAWQPKKLKEVLFHPNLYKAVPDISYTKVVLRNLDNAFWDNEASYNPFTDRITLGSPNKTLLMHEVQHAINYKTGSKFIGTSIEANEGIAQLKIISNRLKQIIDTSKTDEVRKFAQETIDNISDVLKHEDAREHAFGIVRWFYDEASPYIRGRDNSKSVKDLLTWPIKGYGARTEYMKDPGEIESRTVENRIDFTDAERKIITPWETVDATMQYEGLPRSAGTKLYSGIPLDEIAKLTKNFRRMFADFVDSLSLNERERLLDTIRNDWLLSKDPNIKLNARLGLDIAYDALQDAKRRPQDFTDEAMKINKDIFRSKWGDVIGIKREIGTRLYSGIPLDEAKDTIIKGARKIADYTAKARGMKQFKPGTAAKLLRTEFTKNFIDRSGNIRKELLDKLGDEGYKVVQKMYLSKGASSLAANMLKQMRKEVYGGLERSKKKILDDVIFAARMVDIAGYKSEKQFKFPKGMSPADFVSYLEMFRFKSVNGIRDLTESEAHELYHIKEDGSVGGRAGSYYEWMKKPLRDMREAELITEQQEADLSAHNYRRIKLVDLYDKRYGSKVGATKRTIYDSGVEALARGRTTDVYEPSSEVMALEVFNRAYGRILNQAANKALLDLATKDPENPFVRVKQKKGDLIPSGWSRLFVYDKGERKSMWISPEMSKEWITNSPEMSYRLSQFMRIASGSPVLRTFATGINWGFALANLPRDVMHTWFAARTFEDGAWKPVYNPVLPIYGLQIGRDLATVFTDSVLRKGRYEDYIKEGGGMEFLVHQGRILQRGRHLEGPMDAVYNFMGYFGETSEIMTRLAIRERMLRQGKDLKEATFAARDYMDFGQGGGITKALDNAFPYLNATVVATRGILRSFKDNPAASTFKLSQLAALTTGLYIAMQKRTPETAKQLKNDINMQNNICIPLGDDFGFEDENGQIRYPYLKIPLDQSQRFFKKFFEASADKWLGNEIDVDGTVNALESLSPVGISSLPPTVSGALGYVTNKDFWRNEDIWRKTDKPFSYPDSKEEYIPGRTPQGYIDFGAKTGLSPERTKHAVEQLVTSGTLWSYLLGEGYDVAFGDLPKSNKEQHLVEVLAHTPVVKRFFGITNPYAEFGQKIDKAKEGSDLERWIQNRGLDARVQGYLVDKNVERKEIIDYMKSFKDKDVYDRLKDRFEFQEKTKDLPHKSFWLRLKSLNVDARAKVYVDRLETADDSEKAKLRKELSKVIQIGGIVTPEFRDEVMKLRSK